MAGKDQYKASDFIKAIPGSGGIITTIAKRIGCKWHTAKKYIEEYPTIQQAYEDECEAVNDLVVSVILESIKNGNTQDAKWWASRKRRSEYGENIDISSTGEPIQFIIKNVSDTD